MAFILGTGTKGNHSTEVVCYIFCAIAATLFTTVFFKDNGSKQRINFTSTIVALVLSKICRNCLIANSSEGELFTSFMAILIISTSCFYTRFEFKMILTTDGAIKDEKDINLSVAQTAIPLTLLTFNDSMSSTWKILIWIWWEYLWPTVKVLCYVGFELA